MPESLNGRKEVAVENKTIGFVAESHSGPIKTAGTIANNTVSRHGIKKQVGMRLRTYEPEAEFNRSLD